MAEQQQQTTIGEQDFIGTESGFWETAKASALSNPVASVILNQSLREKFWQSNSVPVNDQQIGERVKSEGLDPYLEHFAYVKNVGELDAKVNDIRRQVEHNRTLQMSSGGLGLAATMLGALSDPLNFVLPAAPGFVAGKTIAGTTARGVAAFAAGGALTAGVGESVKVMVNDLDDARSAGVTIGGATVFGGLVGAGVGSFVGRKIASKVGDGVRGEIAGINSGSIPDVKEKLDELVSLQAKPASSVMETPATGSNVTPGVLKASNENIPLPPDSPFGRTTISKVLESSDMMGMDTGKVNGAWREKQSFNVLTEGERKTLRSLSTDSKLTRMDILINDLADEGIYVHALADDFKFSRLDKNGSWYEGHVSDKIADEFTAMQFNDRGYRTFTVDSLNNRFAKAWAERFNQKAKVKATGEAGPGAPIKLEASNFNDNSRVGVTGPNPYTEGVDASLYSGSSGLPFEPTVPDYGRIAASGADLKSLKSIGAERVANRIYKIFGGSIPMEMLNASAATPRMVAAKMGMLRVGFQDGVVAPTSVAGVASRMYGQRDIAREGVILAWHDWAKEGSYLVSAVERNTNASLGLEKFTDLVARAVAYGDNVEHLADAQMRTALSHPAVQKAAKAYRKFDDWMARESVRSGLLRQQHVTDNHLRHDYNVSNVSARRDEFVKVEAERAFQKEWGAIEAEADRTFSEVSLKIQQDFDQRMDGVIQRLADSRQKQEGQGIGAIIQDEEAKMQRALNRETAERMGRRYILDRDKLERKAIRTESAERNKLTRAITRETDPLARERLQADLDGLHTRIENELEGALNALEREHENNWKALTEKLTQQKDERATRELNMLQSRLETKYGKLQDQELNKLVKAYEKQIKENLAERDLKVGEKARGERLDWAKQHADGVAYTITTGDSGVGGSHGRLTGGNIRGGNQARNVYTSTTELLERGYLNTDLLRIMEKQARQEGIDAVIARSFRRNLTDAERRLAARNHGDAYWLDGSDPTTIPDLELRQPTADMRNEYLKLANETQDPQVKVRLTEEHRKQLQNIEEALGIMRGTFMHDIGIGELQHVTRFLKSFNYAVYMGKSLLTNVQDLAKFQMSYGTFHVAQYGVARLRERFTSFIEGNGLLNDAGRQELIESAKAMSFGMEGYNYQRLGALAGIGDPYSASSVNSKLDATGQLMAAMGSKMFGMNYFTNLEKRWAAGLTMQRLGKLAMQEGEIGKVDAAWLRQIGVDSKTLREIRNAHMEQIGEGGYKPGQVLRLNPEDLHPDLADKYAAAVYKDVTQVVVTPHELNKPRVMHNPIVGAMFQFSAFAMESGLSTTTQLGQRLRSGEAWLPLTGVGAMLMGAIAIDLLKTVSDDADGKKTAAWFRAWDRNPGFMTYTMVDKSGVAGALTWASNVVDEMTGVGLRSAMRHQFGDNVKDQYPLSVKRQGQNNQHAVQAWNTLGGATARTLNNGAEIAQDVVGSLAGSKYGAVPLLLSNRRVNQSTLKKAADMTPLAGAFWLRAGIAQGGLMPDIQAWSQTFPKR